MSILARFLLSRRSYSRTEGGALRAKADALLPDAQNELSVCQVTGLTEEEVTSAGRHVLSERGGSRRLHGRAEFPEKELPDGLSFHRDNDPYKGHGVVVGWPAGDDADSIQKRLKLAQRIARASTVLLLPEPLAYEAVDPGTEASP